METKLANKEKGVLLSFLFHSLFETARELQSGILDPQQGITVEMFRTVIGYFQDRSYTFISPEDILRGLDSWGKYVLLTFDDGYQNNVRALPALEEFNIPAVFYVSSGHVRHGKAFWWDVLYRELRKRGSGAGAMRLASSRCKRLKTADIEAELQGQFGKEALKPVSDLDRPFTPAELRVFASCPLVFLGNHTRDHAILTNYTSAGIRDQVQGAQEDILEMTGKLPLTIAYPNGNQSPEIRQAASEAGLSIGLGIQPGRNRLPMKATVREAMHLKRFTLWGDRPIAAQCRASRSGISVYQLAHDLKAAAFSTFTPVRST